MNDQQRIETAADNCEVLRARLAKYEDAEGRPLQPAACLSDVVHHSFSRDREIGWNASEEEQAIRANFDEWLKTSQFTRPNSPWDIWKASARLNSSPVSSAPSHGEQVRAVVPEGWTVERGYSPCGYVLHSPSGSMIRVCDSGMGGIETAFAMFLKALLAAAPSPSKQGGV